MKSEKKRETRGGKRPLSGRKKAPYETKIISFRVKVDMADEVKKLVKDFIKN